MASMDNRQPDTNAEDVTDAVPSSVDSPQSFSRGSQPASASFEGTPDALSSGDSGYDSSSLVLPIHDIATVPRYNMNHSKRGKVLVICNSTFQGHLNITDRNGVEKDIEALKETFEGKMGFEWTCLRNQTTLEMYLAVKEESKIDHSDNDCFVVALLSHGVKGEVYGTDATIEIDKLMEPLKNCQSLVGKPKIVIIQACRGQNTDRGLTFGHDGPGSDSKTAFTIPVEADFLYAYSTADGYVAFNNPKKGSWFIQALCAEFKQNSRNLEVMQMLTRVCHKIAYEQASYTPSRPETHDLKQVSSVTTTLTKALYFT